MYAIYKKSEIAFAIVSIAVYVVLSSAFDALSESIGDSGACAFLFRALLTFILLLFLRKNALFRRYGLCRPSEKASKLLFYLPLALIVSVNLWFGVRMNLSPLAAVFHVLGMLCVGFLEEIIFRGFLFRAMAGDNLKSAVIVSSLTFGIGHIVNLVNGSGADLLSSLCQVAYAAAIGFLFVVLFLRTESLIPCIIAHSAMNALSAFSNDAAIKGTSEIILSLVLCIIAIAYAGYVMRNRNLLSRDK